MTFTAIRQAVLDYCNLTSPEATTRVGTAINRHYRRITSLLGLDATRFVTRTQTTTLDVPTVTFTAIEKLDRVLDATVPTATRLLPEVSVHTLRSTPPGTGAPTGWALQNTAADAVTVLLDTVPQATYALQADGWTTLTDLTGTDEPAFPESFHDVLVWFVIAEELLKKEKLQLAGTYETKAQTLLAELRFHLADSHTRETRQGDRSAPPFAGGGGGGGQGLGDLSYTQTGLITYDRDPDPPFAVSDGSAYVPHLGAEFLGGVPTDRLIGRDTAGTGDSEYLTVGGGLAFTGTGGIGIALDGVTYAQLQNVSAASRLLGRGSAAGAGDPEEITLGTNLSMSGTTLNATTGAASSVAGSDTQVQFNDGGAFGADPGLTFNKTTDALTVGGELICSSNTIIRRNTSDGADTGFLGVAGGGALARDRGAYLTLAGNENASTGQVVLAAGNVAGAAVQLLRSDASVALSIDGATGAATFGAGLYATSPLLLSTVDTNLTHIGGGAGAAQSNGALITLAGVNQATSGSLTLALGARDAANLIVLDAYGRQALVLSGVQGAMTCTSTSSAQLILNSTYVDGGYVTFQRSGVTKGYLGSGALVGGGGTNNDFAIRALGNLYLLADGTQVMAPAIFNNVSGSGTGNVVVDSVGTLRKTSSSRRYKHAIEPLALDWPALLALQPVAFTPNDAPDLRRVGFIAEDVAEIDPRLAIIGPQGSADDVAYTHLTAPLLAAIQDLHARLTVLEERTH